VNRCVVGDERYLCVDCLEEDHDNVMCQPCPECGGRGHDMDEICEWCDGDGTDSM